MKKFTFLIYLLLFSFVSLNAQIVTVGAGTSTQVYPLGSYYGYERSASIYTAAEVGSTGNIVKLAWWANTADIARPIVIYLMGTTSSTLTADTWDNQISAATQVYSGTLTPVVGWNTIDLAVPFNYTGGANNLKVLVEANFGGGGGTGSAGNSVRYSTATSQHEYWRQDYTAPTGNGTVTNNRPNIQITFDTQCTGTPVAGTVTPASQNLCMGATPTTLVATGSVLFLGTSFQWEESNDNGVGDAWAPAIGGSGVTTVSYTPPAFSGTPIYYRLKVTCTNSGLSSQSASVLVSTPVNPSTQTTNVMIPASSIGYSEAVMTWTIGNGSRRVVFISTSATFTDPENGNAPALTPNTIYSGSGQQLIYDGIGTSTVVAGLSTGIQYYIKVYEYERCGSGPYDYFYNTTTGTNIANFTTCGVNSVPATENFTTFVPGCWQRGDNGNLTAGPATFVGSNWISDGLGNVGTTGAARYNIYTTGANDWLLSPIYNIPATGYEIKLDAAAAQYAAATAPTTPWESDDYVEVLVSTGTTNWTVLYTYNDTNVPSHTGTTNIIDLDAYAGQSVRFAFRAVEGSADGGADIDFSVDNFEIRLTPACPNPFGLNVTGITSNGANIGWTATTGNYQYVLDSVATDPAGSGTTLSGETYSTSTLSPNATYYFHVRTVCAGPLYSPWSTISFTTLPTPASNDICADAIVLTPGGVFGDQDITGTIFGANTTAGITPSCQASFAADVWYSVVIPASGNITIETRASASNSMTDSVLAAFSGTCGALTQIGCDDDSNTGASDLMSVLSLAGRTPGEVVYIGVWKYNTTAPSGLNGQFIISAYDASLGATSFDMSSFKAYPNPIKDVLNLTYSTEISSVEVYNMLGQNVMTKTLNVAQGQIDMSNLNAGNYIVKVSADGMTKTIKVVKQ